MKALIIEDERLNAQALKTQIQKLRPGIEIVSITSSIKASTAFLKEHGEDVDIIFSDIRLDDGLSFAIFDRVQTSAMVVFVTGFDEYALKAFDYNCADYLLKPVADNDLEDALARCEMRLPRLSPKGVAQMSAEILSRSVGFRKRLMLEQGTRTTVAQEDDVCYIIADAGGTNIFLKDGTHGYVEESLSQLLQELDPTRFVRASRQHIVALDAIAAFDELPSRRECNLVLREPYSDVQIHIPITRKKELINLLY